MSSGLIETTNLKCFFQSWTWRSIYLNSSIRTCIEGFLLLTYSEYFLIHSYSVMSLWSLLP